MVTIVPEVLRSPTPRNREMSTHTALPLGHGEEPRGPAEHTNGILAHEAEPTKFDPTWSSQSAGGCLPADSTMLLPS